MKAIEHFDFPLEANQESVYQSDGTDECVAEFNTPEQAMIAARAINHADKLAEALEAILTDYNRHVAIYPVDMTDDHCANLHELMVCATSVIEAYRSAR